MPDFFNDSQGSVLANSPGGDDPYGPADRNMLVDAAPAIQPEDPGGSLGLTGTQPYWYDTFMGMPMPAAQETKWKNPAAYMSGIRGSGPVTGPRYGALDQGSTVNGIPTVIEGRQGKSPDAQGIIKPQGTFQADPNPDLKQIDYENIDWNDFPIAT